LRENYPELTNYLLNQSLTAKSLPLRFRPTKTVNKKTEELKPPNFTHKAENNFLFYNNDTNKFEGVSMHSSYSLLKFNKTKNLTLITTTSSPNNHSIAAPLYHQFIYTIKITPINTLNSNSYKNRDLIELLSDQTVDASRSRVSLIREVGEQLGLDPSSIRINWIEKLNSSDSLNDNLSQPSQEEEEEYLDEEEEEDDLDDENPEEDEEEKVDEQNEYNYEVEPQFITDLNNQEQQQHPNRAKHTAKSSGTNAYYILISFSDINLLDLHRTYFQLKKPLISSSKLNQIKSKYENDCRNYFKSIKQRHQDLFKRKAKRFKFNLNNLTNDHEKIKRVQLVKLCDLSQLTSVLGIDQPSGILQTPSHSAKSTALSSLQHQSNEFNLFIRNSTEVINFYQTNKLIDYETNSNQLDPVNSNETTFVEDINYSMLNHNLDEVEMSSSNQKIQVVHFESFSNQTNSTLNEIASSRFWLWSIVPEEDLLLAVIVPSIVVISMIVMTIVVICLLQMCSNDKSKKHLASLSNASDSTHLGMSNTLEKSPNQFSHHTLKSSSIYKEKAYLSKGVPVILYEEMSDKPIDDYDENNRDIMDSPGSNNMGTYRSNKSNYRSPSTLRNEKPPTPAPPEYSRASANIKTNKLFNSTLVDQTDESIALLRKQNSFDEQQPLFYQPPQPIAGLKTDASRRNDNEECVNDKKNSPLNNFNTNSTQQQKQQLNFMLP